MSNQNHTSTPANLPATLTTPNTRADGWTPEKQATFLEHLASTHSVKHAARAVGLSRPSAYKLRARLKGEPFDLSWSAAQLCRLDALAEAALERALNGVEFPHYYKGELVGTSRQYNERLTVSLLAMRSAFAPRRVPDWHGAAQYGPDDFRRLVERVEQGPETWVEEAQLAYAEPEDAIEEWDEDEEWDDDEEWEDDADGASGAV